MKILFLIHRFPGYGGIETVTLVLANFLQKHGCKVAIISYEHTNEALSKKLNVHIPMFRFPNQNEMYSAANINHLYQIIETYKPDVVINQESYDMISSLLVAIKEQIHCKIITVEHNSPDATPILLDNWLRTEKLELTSRSILKRMLHPFLHLKCLYTTRRDHRLLYKNSDRYVLLSEKFVPAFSKISGLHHPTKLRCIYNPLTVKQATSHLDRKEKIVLYVGRIDINQKRVDRLVEIWEKIATLVPDWKLVIVGDGEERAHLMEYANQHNILNISFEGAKTEVTEYYKRASILCLTSNIEGWGLVLTEAMTYGCVPILYNSFASATDIVEHNKNGMLIKPFDENCYAQTLVWLMTQPIERNILSVQASKDSARFDISKIGDRWLKMLEAVVSN